jgi:hypothetical protein
MTTVRGDPSDMERERTDGSREQLDALDEARPTTATTGAGGEAFDDDEATGATARDATTDLETDEMGLGRSGPGGSPPGFVAPPPDADWPDPMGGDDEEREVERRTR